MLAGVTSLEHVDERLRCILDALDDMGLPAKSNLQSLDDGVVEELRGLFKPKPTVAKKVARPDPAEAVPIL